ncbi:MAG TPA: DUF6114 domain-containing protein [Bacillales bacterium]
MNKEKKAMKAEKKQEKFRTKQEKLRDAGRFKQWRKRRPFWGASLTLLAGLLILWIPLNLYMLAFAPGNFAIVGLLFGGLITLIGIMAYIYPQFSTVFGVMTIFLSVISIMGALGGFVVGTILGIVGGALCIAWQREVVPARQKASQTNVKAFPGTKMAESKKTRKTVQKDAPRPVASSKVMFVDQNNEIASALESGSTEANDRNVKNSQTSTEKGQTTKNSRPEDVLEATGATRILQSSGKSENEKRKA